MRACLALVALAAAGCASHNPAPTPETTRALLDRGIERRAQGDHAGAIADFDQVLALRDSDDAFAQRSAARAALHAPKPVARPAAPARQEGVAALRSEDWTRKGNEKRLRGDLEAAVADYSQALRVWPHNPSAWFNRANAQYELGRWSEALHDYRQRLALQPAGAFHDYSALRVWLVRSRLNERAAATAELKAHFGNRADWPSSIARFLAGSASESDLLRVADADRERRCEAYFYVGTLRLIDGARPQATAAFEKCVATGVRSFSEYSAAMVELERARGPVVETK